MSIFVSLYLIFTSVFIAEKFTCKGIEKYLIAQYNEYNYFTSKSFILHACKTRADEIKKQREYKDITIQNK